MRIHLQHVTRIEGHAHLVVDAEGGEIRECRLEVVESPRFFEALLRGKHFTDVAPIAARICGVCCHSHTLASLAATEAALGVEVTEQTLRLRRLLAYGETLQSHLLHLYFLAAPDYLGMSSLLPQAPSSLLPLAASRRELVTRALRMKKVGNDLCRAVGGRAVHPVTACVGGFSALPEAGVLQDLRRRLAGMLPDLEATVALFASFPLPTFQRPAESVCLGGVPGYPLLGGELVSSAGVTAPVASYQSLVQEYTVPWSTAKLARTARGPYEVGPLARIRNAFGALSPLAARAAQALGLTANTDNPYRALHARLVEAVHGTEQAIHAIDTLLAQGLSHEPPGEPAAGAGGRGVGAVEAPRGVLFHAYVYDERGRVEHAECVIPTAQNLGRIEADLRALAPALAGLPPEEIARRLEMLLRAYDPCISCATHVVRVKLAETPGPCP